MRRMFILGRLLPGSLVLSFCILAAIAVQTAPIVNAAGASKCPNAKMFIPSNGVLGWPYRDPAAGGSGHTGIDIRGSTTDDVYAAANGVVTQRSDPWVQIWHEGLGVWTFYTHLSQIFVKVDDPVVGGTTIIGKKGQEGTDNVHLHFSVKWNLQPEWDIQNTRDPSQFLGANVNFQDGSRADQGSVLAWCYSVTLFDLANYDANGSTLKIDGPGFYNIPAWFNDKASSISIPSGWIATVYEHADRGGGRKTYYQSDPNFSDDYFDNTATKVDGRVSSIDVLSDVCPGGTSARFSRSATQCLPPTPSPSPGLDNATLISESISPSDVLSPGQSFTKSWRLKNTGTSTWGTGYAFAYISGDQMNAPGSISVSSTAPNNTVDLSVNMTAPSSPGTYTGYWRMRNPQGVYFGDTVRVQITVPGASPPATSDITVVSVNYPNVVTPNQKFQPQVTVQPVGIQLLQSRGDLLRNTDGNLYGAWQHVAVVGTVNPGQNYTFTFYTDNPITAPSSEGTYQSKWRVWANGAYVGPEITIRFDVRNSGGTRPNPPTLSSPDNWYVSRDGSTPTLCANASGGLQYYFEIYESHDIPQSGWISSNCWTPPTLGPYGYQWHVKARNLGSGLESDWSETRHFNIDSQQLTMDDLVFSPGSPSAADEVRVYTCVRGFGGIGLGLKIEANTATDGSASGDWQWIHHLGTFCYNRDDANTWPNWGTLSLADGDHLVHALGSGPQGQTLEKRAVYHLNRRRPNGAELINPSADAWLNTLSVTFRWNPAWRVTNYRLLVSTNSNPSITPLVDRTLDANTTSYPVNFSTDYPDLYWRVIASNELGSTEATKHFSIDRTAPSSTVSVLPAVSYETALPIAWSGNDGRSGVRWYDSAENTLVSERQRAPAA